MSQFDAAEFDCTIVIPAYNAEEHIREAISSALAQDGVRFEVIVVDDASKDATVSTVRAIEDPRLKLLVRSQNGGAGAARNDAFRAARGRWIAVLDADDLMAPSRLAELVAVGDGAQLDVVADNMLVDAQEGQTLHIAETLDRGIESITLDALFLEALTFRRGRQYGYLKPLFRRSFLVANALAYDESLRVGEDFQLLAHALAHGARLGRVRSAGYVYRRREGSTSHRLKPGHLSAVAAADQAFLDRFGPRLRPQDAQAIRRRMISAQNGEAFVRCVEAIKSRDAASAVGCLWRRPAALLYFAVPVRDRMSRMRSRPRGGA